MRCNGHELFDFRGPCLLMHLALPLPAIGRPSATAMKAEPPCKFRARIGGSVRSGLHHGWRRQRANAVIFLEEVAPRRVGEPTFEDPSVARRPTVVVVVH